MESSTILIGLEVPKVEEEIDAASLYAQLESLGDPRQRRGRRYSLALVLTLVVLAKLAGEKTVSGIAQWARLRQRWLCEVFKLPRQALPCANTYTLVCNMAHNAHSCYQPPQQGFHRLEDQEYPQNRGCFWVQQLSREMIFSAELDALAQPFSERAAFTQRLLTPKKHG